MNYYRPIACIYSDKVRAMFGYESSQKSKLARLDFLLTGFSLSRGAGLGKPANAQITGNVIIVCVYIDYSYHISFDVTGFAALMLYLYAIHVWNVRRIMNECQDLVF